MKPIKLNLKPKRPSTRILLLCVLGVALAAWLAWAAGPVQTKSALGSGQKVKNQPSLAGSSYSRTTGANPSSSGSASGSAAPVSWPPSPQPSNNLCQPHRSGVQPDFVVYPCGCNTSGAVYPCCQYYQGDAQPDCPASYQ
ncbi:MAG TPA: hypothetical protein VFK97_00590 [Candidatus Saccharimonadales bacterium]|nr:hypothetical protein [Candidatus Saccharimonadales bacterium]